MLKLYENIKNRRLELGMTQAQLAEKMGYADKSMIAKIEKGSVDLQQSKIMAFAEALKMEPSELMGWEDAPTSPLYEAAAGEGRHTEWYTNETYNVRVEEDEFAARVCGRSMEPTLQDGDIVVLAAQNVPDFDGQICLVKINGDEATVKRVEIKEHGITLIGDNTAVYPPKFYTEEEVRELPVEVKGVVVRMIREMK